VRIREIYEPNLLIMITNEEADFLNDHKKHIIDLKDLKERELRVAESLLFKDILYKISDHEVMANEFASKKERDNQSI
jgi:hypothetical protein